MGRSTTPRYVVAIRASSSGKTYTRSTWQVRAGNGRTRGDGKPSRENLTKWVRTLEASMRPGGVNAHLGADTIHAASVIDQTTGETVAMYHYLREGMTA
jgi:hypothetical protein